MKNSNKADPRAEIDEIIESLEYIPNDELMKSHMVPQGVIYLEQLCLFL